MAGAWAGLALAAWTAMAMAAPNIVLPRPGQVGVSIQGEYGVLAKSGDFGDLFDNGGTIAVRVRYRMRYERALGISFEAQQFNARTKLAPDTTAAYIFGPKTLTLVTVGPEIYQMFNTDTRNTGMVCAGLGLAQARAELNDKERTFPDDGVYVSAGGEFEHFFWRSWAYDLSARYYAIFQHQKTNHDVQAALGIIFYASY